MARVSNPNATPDDPVAKLIQFLMDHKHWSPFEMVCMCVEIITTRDIARQILRHRSIHFQEFSQRYAEVEETPVISDQARLQDRKNRQNSIPTEDIPINETWAWWQNRVWDFCYAGYQACLKIGIAKELARKLLPEGLTHTRMFAQATIRDWLHYVSIRQGPETQLEHRQIAQLVGQLLEKECPEIAQAAISAGVISAFTTLDHSTETLY